MPEPYQCLRKVMTAPEQPHDDVVGPEPGHICRPELLLKHVCHTGDGRELVPVVIKIPRRICADPVEPEVVLRSSPRQRAAGRRVPRSVAQDAAPVGFPGEAMYVLVVAPAS